MLFAALALATSSAALVPAAHEQTRQEAPRKAAPRGESPPVRQRDRKVEPKRGPEGDGWCRTDGMAVRCALFARPTTPIL